MRNPTSRHHLDARSNLAVSVFLLLCLALLAVPCVAELSEPSCEREAGLHVSAAGGPVAVVAETTPHLPPRLVSERALTAPPEQRVTGADGTLPLRI